VARRAQPDPSKQSLSVDPNPTPDKEAQDFENEDERRLRRERRHEIELLERRQGIIGRVTGSSNASLNNGILVFLLLAVLLCVAEGFQYLGVPNEAIIDGIIKLMLMVVGFIVGSSSPPRR